MSQRIFIPNVDMIFSNSQALIDIIDNCKELSTLIELSLSHDEGLSSQFNSSDGTRCVMFKFIPSWFNYFQCSKGNDVQIGIRCESFVTVLKMLKNSYIRIMYSKERPDVVRLQGLDHSSGDKLIKTLKARQAGKPLRGRAGGGAIDSNHYSSIKDIYGDGLSQQSALEMHLMNIDSETSAIPNGLPFSSCLRVPSKWFKDICDPVLKDKTFADDICLKLEQTEYQQSLPADRATVNFMVISKGDLGTYTIKKSLPVVVHDDEILYFPQGSDKDYLRLVNGEEREEDSDQEHPIVNIDGDDSGNEYNPDSPYSYEMVQKIQREQNRGKGPRDLSDDDDEEENEENMAPVVDILTKRPGQALPKGSPPAKKQKLSSNVTQDWPDSDEEEQEEQTEDVAVEEEDMEDVADDYQPSREDWEVDEEEGQHHHQQHKQKSPQVKRVPEHYVIMDRDCQTPWKITNVVACKFLSVCLGLSKVAPYVNLFLTGSDAEINGARGGIPVCVMYFLDRNESAKERSVYIQYIVPRSANEEDYDIDL
jgi:hypothetical protein